MLALLQSKPISTGIFGTLASGTAGAVAWLATANLVLGFIAGLIGVVTAVFTCLIVIRKWRKSRTEN